MKSSQSNHKYDRAIIKRLCKKQPKEGFNATDVAEQYCEEVGLEFEQIRIRGVQWVIKKEGFHDKESLKPHQTEAYEKATSRKLPSNIPIYLITWAQAHTPIDGKLWENMLTYAKRIGAKIIVLPGTYLNYNSSFKKMVTVWDERVVDYIYASEGSLFKHLTIIPDADILPTASMPLTGMESVTGIESSIIGHPRQHKVVIPTLKNSRRKMMATTGSITLPNYRRARVGKKANTHHKMGFVIAEKINKEEFVMRHVEALADGSFQDIIFKVADGSVTKSAKWSAVVNGDTHLSKEDKEMLRETRRLVRLGKPEFTIWHDLFDGYSINHHDQKDFVSQVVKERKNLNNLQAEVDMSMEFIAQWQDTNMIIIPSNHNDWLDKWVRLGSGGKDLKNAPLFNELQKVLFEEKAPKGLYAYLIDQRFGKKVTTLSRDESFMVATHECNNHGDLGANGAKGVPSTFKRLNTKIVSADKHFLYTYDHAYGVGVTTRLDHGYNRGMSPWVQSSGLIHANGTFQHLIFAGGKFTTLM